MLWFILAIVALYMVGALTERGCALLRALNDDRMKRRVLEDLYREQSLLRLESLAQALEGVENQTLSSRLSTASVDIKSRRALQRALDEELGIR